MLGAKALLPRYHPNLSFQRHLKWLFIGSQTACLFTGCLEMAASKGASGGFHHPSSLSDSFWKLVSSLHYRILLSHLFLNLSMIMFLILQDNNSIYLKKQRHKQRRMGYASLRPRIALRRYAPIRRRRPLYGCITAHLR